MSDNLRYKLTEDPFVVIKQYGTGDEIRFPFQPDGHLPGVVIERDIQKNLDFQEYCKWLDNGGIPEPYESEEGFAE